MSPVLTAVLMLFVAGLATSLVFTGAIRSVARRVGLVDRPDGRRKVHDGAMPVAGGLAVLFSCVVVLAVFASSMTGTAADEFRDNGRQIVGLLVAAVVICTVGIADDVRNLRGRYKFAGQVAAVSVLIVAGVQMDAVAIFGWTRELGWFAIPFTAIFLLGAINSLNLLDGMDGLLGTVGTIISGAIALLAFYAGHPSEACIAAVLAGAMLGFLRYNYPPASIFLGDAGSMLLGLAIGTLAIQSSLKGPATAALAVPTALLIIPIFDTTAAIVRRKLTGRSIFCTDRGHIHHCLLRSGMSRPAILLLLSGLCSLTVLGVLGSIAYHSEVLAVLSAAVVIGILLATRLFGFAEMILLWRTGRHLVRAVWMTRGGRRMEIQLQGSAEWKELWVQLTSQIQSLNLQSIALDVNAPQQQECYHARWLEPAPATGEEPNYWSAVIPLTAWGQNIGQVTVWGRPDEEPVWRKLAVLTTVTDSVEGVLARTSISPATRGNGAYSSESAIDSGSA
jgi:UDP-GlcNAc:undecaprenyl-phosphate GlcNAc-1-phosphate transferase